MKYATWDPIKNATLREARGICFDDVIAALHDGRLLGFIKHPGSGRKHQYLMLVNIGGYAYVVPFVEDEEKWFLKTLFPSRKYTKQYLEK